jgi:tetratricopeptide (TPR) repeat protein
VRFRLHALLPERLDCAPTSDLIERALIAASGVQDLDTRIADAVERMLLGNDPPVREVTVCPFEQAAQEFNACAPALTDRVLRQLDKARTSETAIIRNRALTIARSEPGHCSAPSEAASAYGSIGVDEGGNRFWMSLEFRRGGAILSTTGRLAIFPQDLGCDGKLLRDDIEWRKAESSAANAPAEDYAQRALVYQSYLADCARLGCAHADHADQRLREIYEQQLASEDRANWAKLSVAGKHRDYLDTCVAGPCAYRKAAEEEIAKHVRVYYERGRAYAAKSDYDRAVEQYNEALKLDPKYAVAYNNRGNAYFGKKDYARAIADYDEAIKLDARFAAAYSNRGNAYSGKNDNDRAIADYSEALKLDPKNAAAYNSRGNAYFGKKDYVRAISDYDGAIELDPKYVVAYNNRGNTYEALGRRADALADFRKAQSINPADQASKDGVKRLGSPLK